MSNDPFWRAFLRGTFVDGGLMMISIAIGIWLEKMTQIEPPIVVEGTWFARAGVLLLVLWLPLLWLLKRLEPRADEGDAPDQTLH